MIPATGVRPPFLMLVAVRAIAPVAGIPPNIDEQILATPWAINSVLERWFPPVMPSATTADSKDSILPSIAMVKAGRMSCCKVAKLTEGMTGLGNDEDIAPKRL